MTWNYLFRMVLLFMLLVAAGLLCGVVYTGSMDIANWPQNVRNAILLVPGAAVVLLFFYSLL